MYKTNEIHIRDPYVVVHDNAYYLYKSSGNNIVVYKSCDLENWEEAKVVYTLAEDSWGCQDLWAPEVHLYNGKFYMFLSLLGKHGLRGTEISVSDTPDGTFVPLTNKPATPENKSCIDGTLYVENDVPYIAYSADWPHNYIAERDCYVGEIWAMPLSADLRESAGEPFMLFKSDEAPCSSEYNELEYYGKTVKRYGSDAPFIQKLSDGTLYLTWSPFPGKTYIVAGAVSKDGIRGKWEHIEIPLFGKNGGHAMFFTDLEGKRKMCIHCPERSPEERALFADVTEENGKLKLVE